MKNEITPFTSQLLSISLNAMKPDDRTGSTRMCALKLLGALLANESDSLFKTGTKEEEDEAQLRLASIKEALESLSRGDPRTEVRELATSISKLIF